MLTFYRKHIKSSDHHSLPTTASPQGFNTLGMLNQQVLRPYNQPITQNHTLPIYRRFNTRYRHINASIENHQITIVYPRQLHHISVTPWGCLINKFYVHPISQSLRIIRYQSTVGSTPGAYILSKAYKIIGSP